MGDIMNIGSIHEYNEFLGIETLNPLVAVIELPPGPGPEA